MFRVFQHHIPGWALFQLFADMLLCVGAILLAELHMRSILPAAHVPPLFSQLVMPVTAFALLMSTLYLAVGSYRRMTLGAKAIITLGRPLLAVLLGAGIAYLALSAHGSRGYASELLGVAVLYMTLGIVLVRALVHGAARLSLGASRVLIIGSGSEARSVAADLRDIGHGQIQMVGFYDPDAKSAANIALANVFPGTVPLQSVVTKMRVDNVIVAVGDRRGSLMMDDLLACRIQGIPVLDMAAFYERIKGEVPTSSLRASWFIYGNGFAQGVARKVVKRAFDIISSFILLAIASPIMLITAIAIRLEDKGDIIYKQQRIGLGGREFTCLKFRSMRPDAEHDGVARWACENDTRITRVGRVIRMTRIDELPQLFSVLKGEMSIVGPRPERRCFVDELKGKIPFYDIRHSVKPGLTGWAQIRYRYGASVEDAKRKHQFDLYYIKNNSLFLDLLILIETVSVVIFREGAH